MMILYTVLKDCVVLCACKMVLILQGVMILPVSGIGRKMRMYGTYANNLVRLFVYQ